MALTYEEFSLLERLEAHQGDADSIFADKEDEVWDACAAKGYVDCGRITEAGLAALEPYRVRRAVLVAAGFGSRLVPATLNTPKPLVRVHGKRIIDSLLDAIVAAGIEEIYIVRGYLGEQFDQLRYKYPTVRFIENPFYAEANNISSLVLARYHVQNAYVFESDLLLSNPSLVTKYQYRSNYLAIPMEQSDDWCFDVEDGCIKGIAQGKDAPTWQMVGISYWTERDGLRLAHDLAEMFASPEIRQRFWDEVPLLYRKDNYRVYVRECSSDDAMEIDTFAELQALDGTYA